MTIVVAVVVWMAWQHNVLYKLFSTHFSLMHSSNSISILLVVIAIVWVPFWRRLFLPVFYLFWLFRRLFLLLLEHFNIFTNFAWQFCWHLLKSTLGKPIETESGEKNNALTKYSEHSVHKNNKREKRICHSIRYRFC